MMAKTMKRIFFWKTPEQEEAKDALNTNRWDIQRFQRYLKQCDEQLDKYNRMEYTVDHPNYLHTTGERARWLYSLYEAERKGKFIRANDPEDVEYRKRQLETFCIRLQSLITETSELRFHGTPIYFAEEIIRHGNISSTADRFGGYIRSTDLPGEISVSDINKLSRTLDFFMDMTAYDRCLPCGCLFVLRGNDQSAEQREASVMNAVDFFEDPDRLAAVVTTPENQKRVKCWMKISDLPDELVCTFDEFLESIQKWECSELP